MHPWDIATKITATAIWRIQDSRLDLGQHDTKWWGQQIPTLFNLLLPIVTEEQVTAGDRRKQLALDLSCAAVKAIPLLDNNRPIEEQLNHVGEGLAHLYVDVLKNMPGSEGIGISV